MDENKDFDSMPDDKEEVQEPVPTELMMPPAADLAVPTKGYLSALREKANLALEEKELKNKILVAFTNEKDWVVFGKTVGLSSAGAERIAAHFPIKITDQKREKEVFEDDKGKGYRYIYTGIATLGDREVPVQGVYSTREPFFGVKDEKPRPIEDISESNIMTAAYHRMRGEAIKALLGLRNIPIEEFAKIGIGKNVGNMGGHDFKGKGKDETKKPKALPSTDRESQKQLFGLLNEIFQAGFVFDYSESEGLSIVESGLMDQKTAITISVESLSSFKTQDGNFVKGKSSVKDLSDKQLTFILPKAKKMWEDNQGNTGDKNEQ